MKVKFIIFLSLSLGLITGCTMRMMTPRQAADIGLVTHPELVEINDRLKRIEEKEDRLREQIADFSERLKNHVGFNNDLFEHLNESTEKWIEELKVEVRKR